MKRYAKGILAAVIAGLTALQSALPDGVTQSEWITVALATLIAGGVVAGVPNQPAQPSGPLLDQPQDELG